MRNSVAVFLLLSLRLVLVDVSRGERFAPGTLFNKVPQSSTFSSCLIATLSSCVKYSLSAGLNILSIPIILNCTNTHSQTHRPTHIHQADFTSSLFPIVWRL